MPPSASLLVDAVTPKALELTLAVQHEIQTRLDEADRVRHRQVERAQYEADRAWYRYMQVDPGNRLVADSLEADWNGRLRALAEAQEEYQRQRTADRVTVDSEHRLRGGLRCGERAVGPIFCWTHELQATSDRRWHADRHADRHPTRRPPDNHREVASRGAPRGSDLQRDGPVAVRSPATTSIRRQASERTRRAGCQGQLPCRRCSMKGDPSMSMCSLPSVSWAPAFARHY